MSPPPLNHCRRRERLKMMQLKGLDGNMTFLFVSGINGRMVTPDRSGLIVLIFHCFTSRQWSKAAGEMKTADRSCELNVVRYSH